uniref:ZP domain-containing protein n=1 Tax=Ascaris lumbricoides TaxID=6252 RepID=A0A0M3IRD7_ASCLU
MVSLTIVISFHSFFITKADKAFSVKCFYAQARFATLEHFVNVRCAIDPVILGDLAYEKGAKEAHVYSNAFKFADTNHIAFQCTVQLCSDLEGDQQCSSLSPPSCSVDGFDTNVVTKRFLRRLSDAPFHDEIDVHSHMMAILDTKINTDQRQMSIDGLSSIDDSHHKFGGEVCISQSSFVAYGISGVIFVSTALFVICVQCIALRRSQTDAQPQAC